MARKIISDDEKKIYKQTIKTVLFNHIGKRNRILRGDLLTKVNQKRYIAYISFLGKNEELDPPVPLSDRKMRQFIEELRTEDMFCSRICATTKNGGGYWIAETRAELMENLEIDKRRIKNTYLRIRKQRINSVNAFQVVDASGDLAQMKLFECNEYAG